jgi:glucose/mannose-6-phosphate isomerase
MPVLDDLAGMQSVDKRNMLRLINELPEQCETALGIGRGFAGEPLAIKPNVVLFVGVGDSGLAADMAAEALAEEVEVPVVSQHDSRMPLCVGEESLVFIIDYSGKSQTALRAYRAAHELGATVVCLASGGKLREAVAERGTILNVPSGQPSRCAIGYLLFAPLAAVEQLGLALGAVEKASHAVKLLKNMREFLRSETSTSRNTAKQIAQALFEKTPVIYGAAGYRSLVAARWKSQIGANAKSPACRGVFPNLVDGEICAWEQPGGAFGSPAFVFLTDASDRTNENQPIMQAAGELFARFGVLQTEMKGSTTIERMLYGAYLGDYVSYYLAIMRGVDPLEAQSVAFVNERLAPPEPPRVPAPEPASEAGE